MKMPFIKKISDMDGYNDGYVLFLTEDEAETISSNYWRIKKGESTELGFHDDEEELYIVLAGRAKVKLGETESEVERGNIIYIPRNTNHQSTCISEEDYEFICVANWPDKQPL